MTPRRWLFTFLFALTGLRLVYAGLTELSPDEAYYFLWSERMDICYYSKGPGVAAVIWAGTHLWGVNEFGVRFFAPLLALGTSTILFFFGRRLYNESVGIWTALAMNLVPIFNAGGLLMTIDPLSIFFWSAALYTCWLALEKGAQGTLWWLTTGALVGGGFLCKYTNVLQLLSVVLLLAFTRRYRPEFRRPGFYMMLVAFIPFTLPPLIWNAQHDWITAGHLTARGGLQQAFRFDPTEFLTFILQHFGAYSLLFFPAVILAAVWGFALARDHFKARFLLAFGLPIWVLYLWLALKVAGEANWTAPGMVSLSLLATALWHERMDRRIYRLAASATLLCALLMSIVTLDTDLVRRLRISWPYDSDPSKRLRGWRSAAHEMDRIRTAFERSSGTRPFLIASSYGVASNLAFYLPDKKVEGPGHPPIYFPESQRIENQFSFWPRYDEFVTVPREQLPADAYFNEADGINPFHGRTALYITDRAEERPPSSVKEGFERIEMIACIDQTRRGQHLRQWRVFACYGYRSVPL